MVTQLELSGSRRDAVVVAGCASNEKPCLAGVIQVLWAWALLGVPACISSCSSPNPVAVLHGYNLRGQEPTEAMMQKAGRAGTRFGGYPKGRTSRIGWFGSKVWTGFKCLNLGMGEMAWWVKVLSANPILNPVNHTLEGGNWLPQAMLWVSPWVWWHVPYTPRM